MMDSSEIKTQPVDMVRIGFVGVGGRGTGLLKQLLRIEGCQVTAVCDSMQDRVSRAQGVIKEAGFPEPAGYSKGDTDYERMCQTEDLDLVITATPWLDHARVCVAALNAGKHAATEVPAAQTVDECWQMVEASEKAGKYCMILENYSYFREVMCVLNMIRHGLFGEPMHIYAGYQKEAMYYSFNSDGTLTFAGEGKLMMGNIYPTHHGGPSAQWLDINRGDCFDYLVSMGNYGRAFNLAAAEIFGQDHPLAKTEFHMTDVSNTLIRTKKGRSIHLILDTISPRPHRHYFRLQATNGIYEHIERRVHIHGRSPGEWTRKGEPHVHREWEPIDNYFPEYEHPLWRDVGEKARSSGHGGGDYLMLYRIIQSLRTGTYPDIDVYDTAAWSCIVELSNRSAENRSCPVDIPDFTRGKWKSRKPLQF
jgi:predicted dehydrogenase